KNLATSRKRGEEKEKDIAAGKEQQETIKTILKEMQSETVYKNRDAFIDVIKDAFKGSDITLRAPLLRAIWNALSERDETADVCVKNKKGEIEQDTDLRDTEIIPLSVIINYYIVREVYNHLPDAT